MLLIPSRSVVSVGARWGAGVRRHSEKAGVSFLQPLNQKEGDVWHRHLHVGDITVLIPAEASLAGSTLPTRIFVSLVIGHLRPPPGPSVILSLAVSLCSVARGVRDLLQPGAGSKCFLTPLLRGLQEQLDTRLTPPPPDHQWAVNHDGISYFSPAAEGDLGVTDLGLKLRSMTYWPSGKPP